MTALVYGAYSDQAAIRRAQRDNKLLKPFEGGGKVRMYYSSFTNTTGAVIAQNTIIRLNTLSAGIIVPDLSFLVTSDFGTATNLSIGLDDYRADLGGALIAANAASIVAAADVHTAAATATLRTLGTTAVKAIGGFNVQGTVKLAAQVLADTMAIGATLELWLAMIQD